MNILVTGGSGMIGRALCAFLSGKKNSRIYALGRRAALQPGIDDIVVTEFTPTVLDGALDGIHIDVVFHLAAAGVHPGDRDPRNLEAINRALPPYIVSLASKCGAKAVVMAGSNAEYRVSTECLPLAESMPLETEKLYGATKAAGGLKALEAGDQLGIPVAVARIFNVYGPNEAPHRLLSSLMKAFDEGNPVPLSDGSQIRDFIYVDDVCAGLWQIACTLMDRSLEAGAYNLSTGIGTSVADFARSAAKLYGCDEALLQFGALPRRMDDIPYLVGNPRQLRQRIGWGFRYDVNDGLADIIGKISPHMLDGNLAITQKAARLG